MSDQTSTYAICLQQVGDDDKDNQVLECIATKFQANSDILTITSNVFFLIYSASLVFLMQAGFAMICSGSVRKKNVQNTMLKNLLDVCGAALAFFMFGCKSTGHFRVTDS
jgi:Amt family ammonium transporter